MDRYVVIGNPVEHSLSPAIHARFAAITGERLEYSKLLAHDFARDASRFFAEGGKGASVTLPFKVDAFEMAAVRSDRAKAAGAANFLAMRDGDLHADNTDGAGLVRDLRVNLGIELEGARVLLVGAGGAARGVVIPLLDARVERLTIANRTLARAEELSRRFEPWGALSASTLDGLVGPFDVVINATSTSTQGLPLPLPSRVFEDGAAAYDLMYGPKAEPFVASARAAGAAKTSDGLGMLVEQAAEAFALWRGVRPPTAEVLAELRARTS